MYSISLISEVDRLYFLGLFVQFLSFPEYLLCFCCFQLELWQIFFSLFVCLILLFKLLVVVESSSLQLEVLISPLTFPSSLLLLPDLLHRSLHPSLVLNCTLFPFFFHSLVFLSDLFQLGTFVLLVHALGYFSVSDHLGSMREALIIPLMTSLLKFHKTLVLHFKKFSGILLSMI